MKARGMAAMVVILGLCTGICLASEGRSDAFRPSKGNRIRLAGEPLELGQILTQLRQRTGIETHGLENRRRETVSLEIEAETAEGLFRRLLRHLNVQNFAMEYRGGRLARISVLPTLTAMDKARDPASSVETDTTNATTEVVRVQRVFAGTQAEQLGLLKGDVVIAYNNTMISTHEQLVAQTRKTDPRYPVEMVIVRNDQAMRLTVNGGTIGIGIKTVHILKKDYERFAEAIP